MSFLQPKSVTLPTPPPPPPVAEKVDYERAAAMSEEAVAQARKRRGRGSTIVAGALGDQAGATGGKPTLLG
jgi:hypothetical protein